MKPFSPTQSQFGRMFRPKLPTPQQLFKNGLMLNKLKKKAANDQKPVVHIEPREGVYYQLHEEQKPIKRLMGFKEWCEISKR